MLVSNLRCYSVVRPIMRASHARDWGSNPHSSIGWTDSPRNSFLSGFEPFLRIRFLNSLDFYLQIVVFESESCPGIS